MADNSNPPSVAEIVVTRSSKSTIVGATGVANSTSLASTSVQVSTKTLFNLYALSGENPEESHVPVNASTSVNQLTPLKEPKPF